MSTILLATIAGAAFTLAGIAGILGLRVGHLVRAIAAASAAGILLAACFVELLPESLEIAGERRAALAFLLGFLALFLVESVTKAHVHHHDPDDGHDHSHEDLAAHHAFLPFIIGLALHNLADGLSIGASTELSHESAAAVTTGVLVHQLPVGISFAAVLASIRPGRGELLRTAVALGALIPIGAAVVAAAGTLPEVVVGTLAAAAGGALTYVATGHLLPEAHSEERSLAVTVAFAVTLLGTASFFLAVGGH